MVNVNAFVTLLTSDSYIQGAITLAHSLRLTHTQNEVVCMVTKDISSEIIEQLEKPGELYDKVIRVDEIDSEDQKNLELLGRPELGITFTKLNVWKLVQYEYVAFLDADTIVLKNIDSLFDQIEEVDHKGNTAFLAAPDVGWPDHFNSGVFVCKPDLQVYSDLVHYSKTTGSFDGGDQGLLNRFFHQWINTPKARLSFNYNVTPSAYYTYAPAYQEHLKDIKVVHFIGNEKPWLSTSVSSTPKGKNTTQFSSSKSPMETLVNAWWNIYDNYTVNNGYLAFQPLDQQQHTRFSDLLNNHPYDNAWQTKVIQEPNLPQEHEAELKDSLPEDQQPKEILVDELKESQEDTIRYKWQIRAKVNDDVLPINASNKLPTDHAFITKNIEIKEEKIEHPLEVKEENHPRALNLPEKSGSKETPQIEISFSSHTVPSKMEGYPRDLQINSSSDPNSVPKPMSSNKSPVERSSSLTVPVQRHTSDYDSPFLNNSSNADDFGNYHISWNFNELRGFRKQFKKYIKETEHSYSVPKPNDTVDSSNREAPNTFNEPETEESKDKDDILNISNLPGVHVSELEDEEDEVQHEPSIHNHSVVKDDNVNMEDFDIYGFNYQDDIKKKSFTNESDDGSVKSAGRKRRRSIVEVMNVLEGLAMTKMPTQSDDDQEVSLLEKSLTLEDPLDVTGIIEDNFENDLFINEDEIENLSFVKNRSHIMNDISDIDAGNRSFVSYKDIEKDNIIVEPIPSNEVTEVIPNANDTILPNDIIIDEEIIVNESIIPSEIMGDREVTFNNSMIPNEIIKPKAEKFEESEMTEVPRLNDLLIQVNDIEVQSNPLVPELQENFDKQLLKPNQTNLSLDNKNISEDSSLEEPTMINSTFDIKKSLNSMVEIPEVLEEEEEEIEDPRKEKTLGDPRKEKDLTIYESMMDDYTTEIISDESIEDEQVVVPETLEAEPKELAVPEAPVVPETLEAESKELAVPEAPVVPETLEAESKELAVPEAPVVPETLEAESKELAVPEAPVVPETLEAESKKLAVPEAPVVPETFEAEPKELSVPEVSIIPGLTKKSSIVIARDDAEGQDSSISIEISEVMDDNNNLINEISISHKNSGDIKTSFITKKEEPTTTVVSKEVQLLEEGVEDQEITEIEESIVEYEKKEPTLGNTTEEIYEILIEEVVQDSDEDYEADPRDIVYRESEDEAYEIIIEDVIQDTEKPDMKEDKKLKDHQEVKLINSISEPYEYEIKDVIQEVDPVLDQKNLELNKKDVSINPKEGYEYIIEDVVQEDDKPVISLDKEEEKEDIIEYEVENIVENPSGDSTDKEIELDNSTEEVYEYEIEDSYLEGYEGKAVPRNEVYEIIIEDMIEDDEEKEVHDETKDKDLTEKAEEYEYEIEDVIQEDLEKQDSEIKSKDLPVNEEYEYEIEDVIQENDKDLPAKEEEYEYEIKDVIQESNKDLPAKEYVYEIEDVIQEKETKDEISSPKEEEYKYEIEDVIQENIVNNNVNDKNIKVEEPEIEEKEEIIEYEINNTVENKQAPLDNKNKITEIKESTIEIENEDVHIDSKQEKDISLKKDDSDIDITYHITEDVSENPRNATQEEVTEIDEHTGLREEIIKDPKEEIKEVIIEDVIQEVPEEEEEEETHEIVIENVENDDIQEVPEEEEETHEIVIENVENDDIVKGTKDNENQEMEENSIEIEEKEGVDDMNNKKKVVIKRIIRRRNTTPKQVIEEQVENEQASEPEPQEREQEEEEQEEEEKVVISKIVIEEIIAEIETDSEDTKSEESVKDFRDATVEEQSHPQENEIVTTEIQDKSLDEGEMVTSEVVEETDPQDGHIIRKRIIKRIIRRNGKTTVETEEQPVVEGSDNDETFESSTRDGEVVTSEVVEEADPQDGHIIRKRIIKRIIRRNGKTTIETEEKQLEDGQETENSVLTQSRGKFTSIPFLAENDEVLLLTIIVFGKGHDDLIEQFEKTTNDYYLNKISADEYHTAYVTLLKELCRIKGPEDERYESIETPFMKEHSEQLWNSIADAFAKEESSIDRSMTQKEEEIVTKRRRSCFPFFRKRRHIHSKQKRSKSVNYKNGIVKTNIFSKKQQDMLEAREKYLKENEIVVDNTVAKEKEQEQTLEILKEAIKPVDDNKDEPKQNNEIIMNNSEQPVETQLSVNKSEEEQKQESSTEQSSENEFKPEITNSVKPTEKDHQKKEKKRWWKKLKIHKKKEE